jgi:hypothetical protein
MMDQVVDIVAQTTNIAKEDIFSGKRHRHIVDARRIVINILIREEAFSLVSVTKFLNKNHATGVHHKTVHNKLYASEKAYRSTYDLCLMKYKNGSYSTFSDVKDLVAQNKDAEDKIKDLQSENADLKYTILKLQNKFREHNFMIPA